MDGAVQEQGVVGIPPVLIPLQMREVDLRVNYGAECATAEIALQRGTGRSGAAAARPRHRHRVSRDRATRRLRSDAMLTSAWTAPQGALPPRSPCCGAGEG